MDRIPFTRHAFDLDAYRVVGTFTDGPRVVDGAWARERLIPLWWRGLLAFDGPTWRLTEHGADFCRAHRHALRLAAVDHCAGCGSPYHPSTGHVLTLRLRLCGACACEMSRWVKRHVARRWSKGDFYAAAATSLRPTETT